MDWCFSVVGWFDGGWCFSVSWLLWRDRGEERKETTIFLFILFYWVGCKNKNLDVGCIIKWAGKKSSI